MATAVQSAPVPAHELVYESQQLPKLRSNYGAYLDPDSVGWMKETPIETSLDEMRRGFEEDGYIFVKNLIPREDVLDVREAYFEHLAPTGILKPGSSPRDGIFDENQDAIVHNGVGGTDLPEDIERVNKLQSAHTMPLYLAFLEHPKLREFIQQFMGWEKDVLIKRTMLRHNVPNGLSTGIYYDRIFVRELFRILPCITNTDFRACSSFEQVKPSFLPLGYRLEIAQQRAVESCTWRTPTT